MTMMPTLTWLAVFASLPNSACGPLRGKCRVKLERSPYPHPHPLLQHPVLLFAMKCLFVCLGFVYFNMVPDPRSQPRIPVLVPNLTQMPHPAANTHAHWHTRTLALAHTLAQRDTEKDALSGDLLASAIFAEFNQRTDTRAPQDSTRLPLPSIASHVAMLPYSVASCFFCWPLKR